MNFILVIVSVVFSFQTLVVTAEDQCNNQLVLWKTRYDQCVDKRNKANETIAENYKNCQQNLKFLENDKQRCLEDKQNEIEKHKLKIEDSKEEIKLLKSQLVKSEQKYQNYVNATIYVMSMFESIKMDKLKCQKILSIFNSTKKICFIDDTLKDPIVSGEAVKQNPLLSTIFIIPTIVAVVAIAYICYLKSCKSCCTRGCALCSDYSFSLPILEGIRNTNGFDNDIMNNKSLKNSATKNPKIQKITTNSVQKFHQAMNKDEEEHDIDGIYEVPDVETNISEK